MTHTYVYLYISPHAYAEVRGKLEKANYQHAFKHRGVDECIDMHGIALRVDPAEIADLLPCMGCSSTIRAMAGSSVKIKTWTGAERIICRSCAKAVIEGAKK